MTAGPTVFTARPVITMGATGGSSVREPPPTLPARRAITIEAAYSWRLEQKRGSITTGKATTSTVLERDPYAVEPETLAQIPALGTVYEGRWFPARLRRCT